jgi:hypothetical protein
MSDERKTNKVDPTKVKVGDLMAFTYYVKIKKSNSNGEDLLVEDLDNGGSEIRVQGKELVTSSYSADQFAEEEKVTKTRAAEILINSPNRPLTVSFQKQDGTERVMRGRLVAPEPLLGRSMVEDLETTDKNRLRQVDHRTINWIIVDGVKYTVK